MSRRVILLGTLAWFVCLKGYEIGGVDDVTGRVYLNDLGVFLPGLSLCTELMCVFAVHECRHKGVAHLGLVARLAVLRPIDREEFVLRFVVHGLAFSSLVSLSMSGSIKDI